MRLTRDEIALITVVVLALLIGTAVKRYRQSHSVTPAVASSASTSARPTPRRNVRPPVKMSSGPLGTPSAEEKDE